MLDPARPLGPLTEGHPRVPRGWRRLPADTSFWAQILLEPYPFAARSAPWSWDAVPLLAPEGAFAEAEAPAPDCEPVEPPPPRYGEVALLAPNPPAEARHGRGARLAARQVAAGRGILWLAAGGAVWPAALAAEPDAIVAFAVPPLTRRLNLADIAGLFATAPADLRRGLFFPLLPGETTDADLVSRSASAARTAGASFFVVRRPASQAGTLQGLGRIVAQTRPGAAERLFERAFHGDSEAYWSAWERWGARQAVEHGLGDCLPRPILCGEFGKNLAAAAALGTLSGICARLPGEERRAAELARASRVVEALDVPLDELVRLGNLGVVRGLDAEVQEYLGAQEYLENRACGRERSALAMLAERWRAGGQPPSDILAEATRNV